MHEEHFHVYNNINGKIPRHLSDKTKIRFREKRNIFDALVYFKLISIFSLSMLILTYLITYRSDFPSISWPWYRAWTSPNYKWFPWSICNGCGMPAGNDYPFEHMVPSRFLGSNCWDQIPRTWYVFTRLFTLNTPWYFLDYAYMLFLI